MLDSLVNLDELKRMDKRQVCTAFYFRNLIFVVL